MTPYYATPDGRAVIYLGDCREVLPTLGTFDAVVTDPPYGFGAYATDRALEVQLYASLLDAARTAALFGYPEQLIGLCMALGREPDEWVTWAPPNKCTGAFGRKLMRAAECIAIFGEVSGGRQVMRARAGSSWCRGIAIERGLDPDYARATDVWSDPSPGTRCNSYLRVHPNEKPVTMMLKLVTLCSTPGETICDPFCGSGTTLVAAWQLGRRSVGVEISEAYCEVAAKRLEATVQQPMLDLAPEPRAVQAALPDAPEREG